MYIGDGYLYSECLLQSSGRGHAESNCRIKEHELKDFL
jgi:hypothetical protein